MSAERKANDDLIRGLEEAEAAMEGLRAEGQGLRREREALARDVEAGRGAVRAEGEALDALQKMLGGARAEAERERGEREDAVRPHSGVAVLQAAPAPPRQKREHSTPGQTTTMTTMMM